MNTNGTQKWTLNIHLIALRRRRREAAWWRGGRGAGGEGEEEGEEEGKKNRKTQKRTVSITLAWRRRTTTKTEISAYTRRKQDPLHKAYKK